jgi:hypothetical protein
MYMYVYVEVIKRMPVEEVLDGIERTNKELSCAMTAITQTDKINKKNRDISSYYNSYKF